MRIIPAIDIINGQCVRLSQGDYNQSKVYGDPYEMAKKFWGLGIEYLHLVDLDGAKAARPQNLDILSRISNEINYLNIDFGGGIKDAESLDKVFDNGAKQANIGSLAVKKIGEYVDAGAKYFVCTDIAKDGMLSGSSVNLYRDIIYNYPKINLIASGGVTSLEELQELRHIGCDGAIVGKAIYEGLITIEELVDLKASW